jgi:hypothetical protein
LPCVDIDKQFRHSRKLEAFLAKSSQRPLTGTLEFVFPGVHSWFKHPEMSFDLQPNLTGELIRLRPLTPEDWDALFAVASDPLIWEQHPESDRYKEDVFKLFFGEALESGEALCHH